MFKVEFNRQLGMLGGKLQISEKYSSKNVANNIQAQSKNMCPPWQAGVGKPVIITSLSR